jgi:hypothetical protein
MASTVFQNDLLRLVYGFGDVGHRERMNEVRKELRNKEYSIGRIVADFAESDWASTSSSDFVLFVRECYTPDERQQMKTCLLRCKCCSRHSHYKDLKHKPDDAVPESEDPTEECPCSCRHYARLFKRNNLA